MSYYIGLPFNNGAKYSNTCPVVTKETYWTGASNKCRDDNCYGYTKTDGGYGCQACDRTVANA